MFAVYGVIIIKRLKSVGAKGNAAGRPVSISLQHEYYRNVLSVAARVLCHKGSCTLKDSTKKSRSECHVGGCGKIYPNLDLGQDQSQ